MMRIGRTLLSLLDDVGRVLKRSVVKPKRVLDKDFVAFYSSEGCDVNDIPEFRNAKFTGNESYTAFAKYAHPEPVLSDEQVNDFDQAVEWMGMEFGLHMSDSVILPTDAVISGTEGRNSPGYPWNQVHKSCNDFYASDDRRYLEDYWERSLTRDGAFTIFNSFLKEELRKIAKIQAGDIRQINGCAVEFKIAMNRYCLNMNEKFYDSNMKTASAVGINKYYGGWDRLYRKLNVHPTGFSLDVKRWDSHFPRRLMEAIRDFRWECLGSEYKTKANMRRFFNLYEQIIETNTVMNWGEILRTRLGNPSGSPNTVVDNTLGLFVLVAYCFIRSCRAQDLECTYGLFCHNIALVLYGDDNTFTGSDSGLKVLNFDSVSRYAAELNFEVTCGGHPDPRPVHQLDFLSSVFHKTRGGMMVCKPKAPHKALASMAFRGDGDRLISWSRACAHRLNSFFEPESFGIADRYCKYLCHKLDRESEAEGWMDLWKAKRAEYLPVRKLWYLHCGKESGCA